MEKPKRVVYYDLLNICACLCVVFMHHNALVHTYSPTRAWKEALAVEVLAYWAVPVFLMLSGATLMTYRKRYSTGQFFKKRVLRTVFPYLFWTAACALILSAVGFYTLPTDGKGIFDLFLNYRSNEHYWFFPILFTMYMFLPLLSVMAEHASRKLLWYAAAAIFFTRCVPELLFPLLGKEVLGTDWNFMYAFPVVTYVLFLIMGYLLSTAELSLPVRIAFYLGGIAGAVSRFAGIYLLSARDGRKNDLFFSYTLAPAVLLACGVFVFFRYASRWLEGRRHSPFTPRVRRVLADISACSLGVYLIHYLVMVGEALLIFPGMTAESRVWRWAVPFMTYAVSLAVVWLVRKVPVLRRIFP